MDPSLQKRILNKQINTLSDYPGLDQKFFHPVVYFDGPYCSPPVEIRGVVTGDLSQYIINFRKEILPRGVPESLFEKLCRLCRPQS
jgi:hypothetical protein